MACSFGLWGPFFPLVAFCGAGRRREDAFWTGSVCWSATLISFANLTFSLPLTPCVVQFVRIVAAFPCFSVFVPGIPPFSFFPFFPLRFFCVRRRALRRSKLRLGSPLGHHKPFPFGLGVWLCKWHAFQSFYFYLDFCLIIATQPFPLSNTNSCRWSVHWCPVCFFCFNFAVKSVMYFFIGPGVFFRLCGWLSFGAGPISNLGSFFSVSGPSPYSGNSSSPSPFCLRPGTNRVFLISFFGVFLFLISLLGLGCLFGSIWWFICLVTFSVHFVSPFPPLFPRYPLTRHFIRYFLQTRSCWTKWSNTSRFFFFCGGLFYGRITFCFFFWVLLHRRSFFRSVLVLPGGTFCTGFWPTSPVNRLCEF